jgi:hypothetical protein
LRAGSPRVVEIGCPRAGWRLGVGRVGWATRALRRCASVEWETGLLKVAEPDVALCSCLDSCDLEAY